jgi:hypothetical protein
MNSIEVVSVTKIFDVNSTDAMEGAERRFDDLRSINFSRAVALSAPLYAER